MEWAEDENYQLEAIGTSGDVIDSRSAVNSLILDYYKKFGRKRDLEQFFSLSTAQSDIRDTTGLFWRKMKSENDSSDSGGRKSDSSHEVCRISIRCSVPPESSSQDDDPKTKTESPQTVSPPIITEEVDGDDTRHTDDEFNKSDDNNSQKSLEALLDLSAHKPLSPTSSITSQRKLEWDSLADVGYGNESDHKTSASSLSTLERLALKQQYSNNDSKQDIGLPTSQSTPLDEKDPKSKVKKGVGKKTKIYQRDVDVVEFNVPSTSNANPHQSISVNLTKHISFNVEKDGGITVDNVSRDVSVSPEKPPIQRVNTPYSGADKEIQTSLNKSKELPSTSNAPNPVPFDSQKIPVMISLNTLRKRLRKKRTRVIRKRIKSKKKVEPEVPHQEKSGEHLSAAESFEYMPGHIYNQNQLQANEPKPGNSTGNKSSLESSGVLTTDSSKGSKHSITKDLEKCIDLLKVTLKQRYDDGDLKKKLIKEIVQRLVNSKYRDDDSTTDFLSGLSLSSKKIDPRRNNTTSSTSDANNTDDSNQKRPKKSILRMDKFNPNVVASTSQSAPNLLIATSNEDDNKISTNLTKLITSNTDSDSSRNKSSSDNGLPKTSSEQLYQKYLEALKREEAYKRHLKDKEMFLKQKLVKSDTAFKVPVQTPKVNRRLKDLMNDLTRNNYDDGSGDASKLEGSLSIDYDRQATNQRNHSVFTLSSSNSEGKRPNLKKKSQNDKEDIETNRDHYCCCPHHFIPTSKISYVDSSVQVNLRCFEQQSSNDKSDKNKTLKACPRCNNPQAKSPRVISDNAGEVKYVCLCNTKTVDSNNTSDKVKVYKCSRLTNRAVQMGDSCKIRDRGVQCNCNPIDDVQTIGGPFVLNDETSSSGKTSNARRYCTSSNAELLINMMCSENSQDAKAVDLHGTSTRCIVGGHIPRTIAINEATRLLQTEISINPRIGEATLSDINIVDDCVKLCSEHTRHVPACSGCFDTKKTYSDVHTSCGTEKLLIPSEESLFDNSIKNRGSPTANDFMIPIDAKVNLRVKLGDTNNNDDTETMNRRLKSHSEINTRDNQNVGTNFADGPTSIPDEHTKYGRCPCKYCRMKQSCNCAYDPNKKCLMGDNSGSPRDRRNREKSPTRKTHEKSPRKSVRPKISPDGILRQRSPSYPTDGLSNLRENEFEKEQRRRASAPSHIYVEKGPEETKRRPRSPIDNYSEHTSRDNSPRNISFTSEISRDKNTRRRSPRNMSPSDYSPRESNKRGIIRREQSPSNNSLREKSSNNNSPRKGSPREISPRPKSPERNRLLEKASHSETSDRKSSRVKPNTYPKQLSIKEKKPSNTDTDVTTNKDSLDIKKAAEGITKCVACNTEISNVPTQNDMGTETDENKDLIQTTKLAYGTKLNYVVGPRATKTQMTQIENYCNELPVSKTNKDPMQIKPINEDSPITKTNTLRTQVDSNNDDHDRLPVTTSQFVETDPKNHPDPIKGTGSQDKSTTRCLYCGSEPKIEIPPINKAMANIGNCDKSAPTSLNYGMQFETQPSQSEVKEQKAQTKNKIEHEALPSTSKGVTSVLDQNDHLEGNNERPATMSSEEYKSMRPSSTTSCVGTDPIVEPESIPSNFAVSSRHPTLDSGVSSKHSKDPILDMIQDITRRYSKGEIVKMKKNKCFKEVIAVLNYLLETDDSTTTDQEAKPTKKSIKSVSQEVLNKVKCTCDKAVQLSSSSRKSSKTTESSDLPVSTDLPTTSSDSAACKVLRKIKKECEKFHQKRCKVGRKCEISSSTSANCDLCQKVHHCSCKNHKCKRTKAYIDKLQKKCIAYNLIIKNSDSFVEQAVEEKVCRPLKNVVIKVPKTLQKGSNKETVFKVEKEAKYTQSREKSRSHSCPNESEMSSTDEVMLTRTVREYLEKNRPDFVEKCSKRQHCLKFINERRRPTGTPRLRMVVVHQPNCAAKMFPIQYCKDGPMCHNRNIRCNMMHVPCEPNVLGPNIDCSFISKQNQETKVDMCYNPNPCDSCEPNSKWVDSCPPCVMHVQNKVTNVASDRASKRDLVSLQVEQQPDLTNLSSDDLRQLAQQIGIDLRKKKLAPKFISEREMKKHSEHIYKSLPEVVRKREEAKKENVKKTNMLMANIFRKNLQKKALRGSVNISNYSSVITI